MANDSFGELFHAQRLNQIFLLNAGKYDEFTDSHEPEPVDDPHLCSYHVQQLVSEIGEVLEADKRWKNFRNDKYDRDAKLDEIADCFIVLMNISMFSGFSADDVANAISKINPLKSVESAEWKTLFTKDELKKNLNLFQLN